MIKMEQGIFTDEYKTATEQHMRKCKNSIKVGGKARE